MLLPFVYNIQLANRGSLVSKATFGNDITVSIATHCNRAKFEIHSSNLLMIGNVDLKL